MLEIMSGPGLELGEIWSKSFITLIAFKINENKFKSYLLGTERKLLGIIIIIKVKEDTELLYTKEKYCAKLETISWRPY